MAAENFWGSIASQLGGDRVEVESIITNPNTDPHDYEPTAADGRSVAEARFVIENGVGYDPWIARLVAANRTAGQRVLDVGRLVGATSGDNPHRWYFPADVQQVITRITHILQRLDPAHASYYSERRQHIEMRGLATYRSLLDRIRRHFRGTPVGASESIFEGIAQSTGLDLVTPPAFLEAISEGTDPTAANTATVHDQIADHRIDVWVDNSQNATPDVRSLTSAARAKGIPVATITETMVPASGTFQQWQVRQLRALLAALHRGTGR